MNLSLALKRIRGTIAHFIGRFHVLIFVLTVVVGVSIALLLLVNILSSSSAKEGAQPAAPTTFDQKTIDRIDQFNTHDSGADNFSLPSGRINPLAP